MKNVVAISLAVFLVPVAGCLDELSEPAKIELTDKEVTLLDGDYFRLGPAVGYEQFEWNFTHIPTEGKSSNFSWDIFFMNASNFQLFEDGDLTAEYFVNGSWISVDGNVTKGPFSVDSSDGYYLVVENSRGNENGDTLRFRIQFYGWK